MNNIVTKSIKNEIFKKYYLFLIFENRDPYPG